jgi:hypothetical protein
MPFMMAALNVQTLALAFIAGFAAVLVFHQGLYALLYAGGVIPRAKPPAPPNAPWDMTGVPPLGVPRVISSSFWGGIWAIALWPLLSVFTGPAFWLAWFIAGGVALTTVFFFVVLPLKGQQMPFSVPRFLVGCLLNGAWGVGTALFMRGLAGVVG